MKRYIFKILLLLIPSIVFSAGLITGMKKRYVSPDKVLFKEDFSKCPVGEPPMGFDKFEGAGECVEYENQIWVAPATDGDYKLYKKVDLGRDEFAIEFDFLAYQDAGVADFIFRLLKSKDNSWDRDRVNQDVEVFDAYKAYTFRLEGVGDIGKFKNFHKKKIHISIQVRRGQLRVYANGKRLTVVPLNLASNEHISGVEFMFIRDTNKYGVLLSNIKIGKYSLAEEKPNPQKVGIKVQKLNNGEKLTIPEKVLFDFNKFFLKDEAKKALHVVGQYLNETPNKKILIVGYTDNVGSSEYNLKLSLQRAQSVADYLIYVEKLNKDRVKIEGRGEAEPIADNSTDEGRAKNRRVEIIIKD